MFEIKCIVGDKKLSDVLRVLSGLTLEPPVITPVTVKEETQANTPPKEGTATDLLLDYVKNKGVGKNITVREMREFLESKGFTRNGYSYVLTNLKHRGVLSAVKGVLSTYKIKEVSE